MIKIYWILMFLIFYTYFLYPVLLVIASVFFTKKISVDENYEPTVTLLICAYNEEKDIGRKLENSLLIDYPRDKLEILVVSDGSTDGTDRVVRGFDGRHIKLFRVEGRVGKTEAQNQAVSIAWGEIIVFSDATTQYEPSALRKIVRNFSDPSIGAVSGRYRYIDPKKTNVGKGSIAFWDYENLIKTCQSRLCTITGCCGCIYSIRKRLYVRLPADIISDLVEPLKILEEGHRIVFEPDAIAYEFAFERTKEEFKMRIRVVSRGIRGLLYMRNLFNPLRFGIISIQLFSHKVLRWLVPVWALLLYIVNTDLLKTNMFFFITWICQTIFYALALLGFIFELRGKKIVYFSYPLYFCIVNGASIISLIRIIRKRKDIQWETVRT